MNALLQKCIYVIPVFCCLFFSTEGLAQEKRTITGIVKSNRGELLPGVAIFTDDPKPKGTYTDFEGGFTIQVTKKTSKLIFSYLGFESQEKIIIGLSELQITMHEASNELDEVVVIGYGTQKRKDVTGAISSIKADEINRTVNLNMGEALQGKVAGLQVISEDGTPGGGFSVKIRGASSISGSAEPLYVVDGFPIEVFGNDPDVNNGYEGGGSSSPLDFLDASLIESIEVLKDASATAIYGARGANGVVIITTKKGVKGTPKITYSVSTSLTKVPANRLPQMLSTSEIFDFRVNQAYYSSENRQRVADTEEWTYLNSYDSFTLPHPYDAETQLTKKEWNEQLGNTNWFDEILRTGVVTNHVLGISGGTEQVLYNYSLSYLKNEGVVIGSGYDRFVVNMNFKNKISDKLSFQTTISPNYSKQYGTGGGGGATASNSWGFFTRTLSTMPYVTFDDQSIVSEDAILDDDEGQAYYNNPVYQALNEINNNTKYGFRLFTKGTYEILKGLKANIDFGVSVNRGERRSYNPANFGIGALKRTQGQAVRVDKTAVSYTNSNILNYNTQFGNHKWNATLGFTQQSNSSETYTEVATQFDPSVEDGSVDFDKAGEYKTPRIRNQEIKQVGLLARLNYVYDGRYSVTASIRRDGDSRFNSDSRFRNFPSAAFAWTVSKENFMAGATAIDNLKIRASYGTAGNSGTRPNDSRETFVDFKYNFGGGYETGAGARLLVDENLTWQSTSQFDIGADMSLFKNRVSLVFDVYSKHTKNLILDQPLSPNTGFIIYRTNAGEFKSWGYEFSLNTINLRKRSFEWNSTLTLSIDRSKILDLNGPNQQVFPDRLTDKSSVSLIVGENLGTWTGYKMDGIYDTWAEIEASPITTINGRDLQPGDPKYVDVNGDGFINESDLTVIANTQPKFYGGFFNNFRYKNFNLGLFFNFKYDMDVINGDLFKFEYTNNMNGNGAKNQMASVLNAWSPDNLNTTSPGYHFVAPGNAKPDLTSYHIEDGSYIRLQNISFSYDVPNKVLESSIINSIRLAFNVNNAYLWTKYTGSDPDNSISRGRNAYLAPNLDFATYPRARAWNTTLILGF